MPADFIEPFPAARVATAPDWLFEVVVGLADPGAAEEGVPVDDVGNAVLEIALMDNTLVTRVVWGDVLVGFATNSLEYCLPVDG
ncbi:hypothetical protein MMC30_007111 [Trapelia coarctata]|nr:hypothetical protein [Trapelia coarctata]